MLRPGVPPGSPADPFWHSLSLFNIYRFIVTVILFVVAMTWGNRLPFGSRDLVLFVLTTTVYGAFALGCFLLIRIRWRFDLQLTVQVAADVVFIVVLMYASDGISSGLGLLLLTVLAGAGLISRGRLALFHAALASIGVLLEHTYEVLRFDASVAQYAQAGLLSGAYFTTAWVAHALAKYTVASEQLAAQREIDLQNLAQVNQHVIQDMKDGVLVVDGSGVIRQFNARAEQLLGPLRGRRDVLLRTYAPALQDCYAEWRDETGEADINSQVPFARTLTARFVPVGRRRSAGALIFLEDVTRMQEEARQLKLAALGRLTANLAHEIRNPLGAISHATELLQEDSPADETSRRLLTIIHDNARRLDRMVHDVLWLNRGDRVQREAIDLVDCLTAFVEQFCEIEKIGPPIFRIELHARPVVLFDRSHLDQVLWNLSRNALRHCRREDGSIQIIVGLEHGASAVRIDMLDDGPGVPPELRSQLFEPFFTTSSRGTGLGLYIAREVCEANGAVLEHVETPHGAQFTIVCRAGKERGQ